MRSEGWGRGRKKGMGKRKESKRKIGRWKEREGQRWIPNGEWWSLLIRSAAQAVSFGHSIIQSFGWCCFPLRGFGPYTQTSHAEPQNRTQKHESYSSVGEWESNTGLQIGKMEGFSWFRCVFIHSFPNRSNLGVVTFSLLHAIFPFSGSSRSCYWKTSVHLVVNWKSENPTLPRMQLLKAF